MCAIKMVKDQYLDSVVERLCREVGGAAAVRSPSPAGVIIGRLCRAAA
jgi:hypothetical protein